jgi:hypothetical protein
MLYDIIMWFYASMALMIGVLLFMRWARPKSPPQFPPELICDGCGQVCSDLLGGYCEYCVKKLAK